MTIRKASKIWIGIGTAAALGATGGVPTSAQTQGQFRLAQAQDAKGAGASHAGHEMKAPAATEGGEGGEGNAAGLDSRTRFFRDMELVRGHLLVGDELVRSGHWLDALPHFHHPIEELYPNIGAQLKLHSVRQFDSALKALAQAVQSRKIEAYATAVRTVEQRMAEVDKAMRKFADPYVEWRVKSLIAVLQSAASEYREAIEGNRIAKPVEYQDSRGFVFQAGKMLDGLSGELAKKDAGAVQSVTAALAKLKEGWPAPLPPEQPVLQPSEVLGLVSRVELAAGNFTRK